MAKAKRPEPSSNRSGMDYYEYKRQHDMVRMRQRAVEVAGDVERPEDPIAHEVEDQRGVQRFKLLGGLKRTKDVSEPVEDAASAPAERAMPEAPAQEHVQMSAQHKNDPEEAITEDEAPDAANGLVSLDLQDEDGEGDDLEITNPFASALEKLKHFSGKLASGTAALRQRMARPEREDDDDDEGGQPPQAETVPSLTMALSDDDGAPPRRRRASAVHMVSNEDEGSEDPLGVMRPMDERTHLPFMRPEAQNPSGGDHEPEQAVLVDSVSREGNSMNDNEMTRPELTEKLMDDLNNVPALSRRERKAMASAGTLTKPATKTQDEDEDDVDVPVRVDEPTQQFKPLRARPVKPAPSDEADEDEDDEDDEDDIAPKKSRFGGFGKKRRVYRDEDLDDEEDDDYEDDAEYDEDDYDEDEDDEEAYDDYDEDEAFESAYHVSFGKRVLGFLKGILILALIFLLAVVALRQLEASKVLSLDIVRETIGQIIPIDNVLPQPKDEGATPIAPLPDVTPEPAQTQEPTPSPAPTATPAPESEPVVDPGAQGNPLEQDIAPEEDASLQGAGSAVI